MAAIIYFDRHNQQFIGATGFHSIAWEVPRVETGYWIRTSYQGQGYMTETINAITQYAFKQLAVKRIAITCDTKNVRSKKIPERLGYHLEATLKANRISIDGDLSDTLVYACYDIKNLPPLEVIWD